MKRGVIALAALFSVVTGNNDEGIQLAARLAAMKAKTHQTLTAAKDVAPLIARVDKDLLALASQKQDLEKQKHVLLQRRQELLEVLNTKNADLDALQKETGAVEEILQLRFVQWGALTAQRSIQAESEGVAQTLGRDRLLAHVFETTFTTTAKLSSGRSIARDYFVAEDVRG